MPSPFPGMNPYLEQNDTWQDFHNSFLIHARDSLTGQVGPNYLVKVEVRLIVHELPAEERHFLGMSDVGVTTPESRIPSTSAAAVLEAPYILEFPEVEKERHASIEIRDRRNRRVITVIELLSPSSKGGDDRNDYLAKRRQVLAGPTHLVEIDLLRGGERPAPPELPACDYYALVSRYEDRPRFGFWPIGLRDSLPILKIPLDRPDPPVHLDLKGVLDLTYDAADYGKYIYQETPVPPLTPADAVWAQALISHLSDSTTR